MSKKKSLNPFDDEEEEEEVVVVKDKVMPKEEKAHNKLHAAATGKEGKIDSSFVPAPAPPPVVVEAITMKGSKKEPVPKFGHTSATVNEKVYVWGGWRKGFPEEHSSPEKTSLLSMMDVFDLKKGEWSEVETYGSPPLGVRGYSCTAIGTKIYYFGGYCGHDMCRHSSLHCLDTTTLQWTNILPSNPYQSPMKKSSSGMVAFRDESKDYLFVFGGVGMLCSANQSEAIYIPWKENPDNGWTNEAHIFSSETKEWITPAVKGERPPPCAGFTLTQITHNSALLYGGVDSTSGQCLNDAYIIELSKDSIHWYKVEVMPDKPKPTKRHEHSAVCISGPLFGQVKPMVLVSGGRDSRWQSVKDLWILDCSSSMWTKLDVPDSVACRQFHSISVFSVAGYCRYGVTFGGITEWTPNASLNDQAILSDTNVLEMCSNSDDRWEVTAVLDSQMLRETEEYKGRMIQRLFHILKHKEKDAQKHDTSTQEMMRLRSELEQVQSRLTEAESKAQSLQQELQQLQDQKTPPPSSSSPLDATSEATPTSTLNKTTPPQTPKSKTPPSKRATPSSTRKATSPSAKKSTTLFSPSKQSPPLTPKTSKATPTEATALILHLPEASLDYRAQHIAIELTSDALRPHLISRDDITTNGPNIHTGSYGYTVLGHYKGNLPVSVKILKIKGSGDEAYGRVVLNHKLVQSFQIRHPNIAQLLFACTQDGVEGEREIALVFEPITVTLQQQLTKKALPKQDIINLSLDVGMALDYLHSHSPYPIVHGSVSTAGITLEPLALKWRAKLVDFFTANCFYYASTETPFVIDPFYIPPPSPSSSPPASDVPVLSTKFDIFGFGIVLLETVTQKQPPVEEQRRESLINSVKWPSLSSVIRNCTKALDTDRPSAVQLLNDLHKL